MPQRDAFTQQRPLLAVIALAFSRFRAFVAMKTPTRRWRYGRHGYDCQGYERQNIGFRAMNVRAMNVSARTEPMCPKTYDDRLRKCTNSYDNPLRTGKKHLITHRRGVIAILDRDALIKRLNGTYASSDAD